jgi:zinc finger FYVE domain-containing protein 26
MMGDADLRLREALWYCAAFGGHEWVLRLLGSTPGAVEPAVAYIKVAVGEGGGAVPLSSIIEYVAWPTLGRGDLLYVLTELKNQDPDYQTTRPFVAALCKELSMKGAFQVLLDVQEAVGDFSRAGLTSLKLFVNTRAQDFGRRLGYLARAERFFSRAQQAERAHVSDGEVVLEATELGRYMRATRLQRDVIQWEREVGEPLQTTTTPRRSLNLFGPTEEKIRMAHVLLLSGKYELAFSIVQEFQLPAASVYSSAAQAAAAARRFQLVADMLRDARPTLDDAEWDTVLLAAVRGAAVDAGDPRTGERLANDLVNPRAAVQVCIVCGKLKAAYLGAAQMGDSALVTEVYEAAQACKGTDAAARTVLGLCEKFFVASSQESARS